MDFQITGCLQSPKEKDLMVILSDEFVRGWEGPPHVFHLFVNSSGTKEGFDINTKKRSRELNDLGMEFYNKFWALKDKDIDRDDIWGCGFGDSVTDKILKKAEIYFDLAYNVSELTEDEPYYQALYNKASVQALRFQQKEAYKTIKKLLSFKEVSQRYQEKIKKDSDFYSLSMEIERGDLEGELDTSYIDDFNYLLTGSKKHTLKYKEIKDWRYLDRRGICG